MPDDESKDELMDHAEQGQLHDAHPVRAAGQRAEDGSVGQIMSMIPGLSNSGIFDKVLHHVRLISFFIELAEKDDAPME